MTIITGGSRSNTKHFAWYFQRTVEGQRSTIRDVVGLTGHDMTGWLEQMEAMALGGNTDNIIYHFSVNPRDDEPFTDEQMRISIARTLRNLGLSEQPYFVIEHDKDDGRSPHCHVIALRVSLDTGKAISDSNNYAIHMRTADQLEKLFEHQPTGRGPGGRNPKNYEVQRGKESGLDVVDVGAELTDLWRQSDTAQALAAAIEEHGYILCEGRRGLCVIDPAGDTHSLASRIEGARKKDIDARFAGVDRSVLPTVEEARVIRRNRPDREDGEPVSISPDAPVIEPQHGAEAAPAEPSAFDRVAADLLTGTYQRSEKERSGRRASESPPPGRERPARRRSEPVPYEATDAQWNAAYREAPVAGRLIADGLGWIGRKIKGLFSGPPATSAERATLAPEAVAKQLPAPQLNTPGEPAGPAPSSEMKGFEQLAQDMAKHDSAPEPPAASAALAEGEHPFAKLLREHAQTAPSSEPELSEFDRVARAMKRAMRAGGGELSLAASLKRLQEHIGPEAAETDEPRTEFDRVARATKRAMRANGGEPVMPGRLTLWQRTAAVLSATYDRAASVTNDLVESFVERVLRSRAAHQQDTERER